MPYANFESKRFGLACVVASLDRKRLGKTLRVGRNRSEAFSIRRLGGRRWRLRRTRCAMGFERQFGAQELCGWVRKRRISGVCGAARNRRTVGGRSGERSWTPGKHTDASSCLRTSKLQN